MKRKFILLMFSLLRTFLLLPKLILVTDSIIVNSQLSRKALFSRLLIIVVFPQLLKCLILFNWKHYLIKFLRISYYNTLDCFHFKSLVDTKIWEDFVNELTVTQLFIIWLRSMSFIYFDMSWDESLSSTVRRNVHYIELDLHKIRIPA